jgi:hypothetical protein
MPSFMRARNQKRLVIQYAVAMQRVTQLSRGFLVSR